ncbi:hypothetical protein Trydic_g3359 [Trypoxylus dichotomus]
MKNQPSNQSKDNRLFYQSSHSREIRHASRQGSANCKRSSHSGHEVETKQESYYEYVPSTRASYEKPSLPYYVVPVLYVPQKVLSSEEIRPSSSVQNKNTVSFLVKNQKQSKERMIDVDKIPCIPCEIKKKTQKKDICEKEEVLVSHINLDQPCTGYINAGYTQSSTSVLEDTSCQSDMPNCNAKKYTSPVYVQYENKIYKQPQPARRCKPQVYQKFLQHQQKFANIRNNIEVCEMPRSSLYLHWNPGRNCYETVEEACTSANEISVYDCEKKQKIYIKKKKESLEQTSDITKPGNSYMVDGRYYDTFSPKNNPCNNAFAYESFPNNTVPCDYDYSAPEIVEYQDCVENTSYEDVNDLQPDSRLACKKATRVIKEMSSLIGMEYDCEVPREPCYTQTTDPSAHSHESTPETFTTAPLEIKNQRSLKQPSMMLLYTTVDPATTSVTTSTQTNRVARAFESCPPSYIDQIHEEVGIMIRPRIRETSPSPIRCRRNASPVKQSSFPPGDAKRLTIMKTAEMLQKPTSNQCTSFPAKVSKTKRRKPRSPLSP